MNVERGIIKRAHTIEHKVQNNNREKRGFQGGFYVSSMNINLRLINK